MDGVTFLKRFMPVMPTPTVMISSLTQEGKKITLEALEAGAVDVVAKPVVGWSTGLPLMLDDICRARQSGGAASMYRDLRAIRRRASVERVDPLGETTDQVIAIGASTGGVQALRRIMPAFPADSSRYCHRPAHAGRLHGELRRTT